VAPSRVVTLTGQVDTWGEARAADQDARHAGASRVVNDLQVRGTPGFTAPK
jgi:osmotically-inducible protein OsmY